MQQSAGDPAHSIPPYSLGSELANGEERQWVARETSTTGCGSCRHHWASFGMRVFATGELARSASTRSPRLFPPGIPFRRLYAASSTPTWCERKVLHRFRYRSSTVAGRLLPSLDTTR